MNVSEDLQVTFTDFPDPTNCAITVFFYGCGHNCPGCQNKELQDFNGGKDYYSDQLFEKIDKEAKRAHTKNIVLSGGDPIYQHGIQLINLCIALHNSGYKICIYTGFSIEEVKKYLGPRADFYKCGVYDETQKEKEWGMFSDRMVFATKNQKLYDEKFKQISKQNVYYFKHKFSLKNIFKCMKREQSV